GFDSIRKPLEKMQEVGLGYLKLGQPSTTLSGGEAQRIKLATHMLRPLSGHTLFVLDEPTTGLHSADVADLIQVFHQIADHPNNSILVIEHNVDVIKNADWIIDLGPGGGQDGGNLVAEGTVSDIRQSPSLTGKFL
ncbi:MAG: excinuclease ABC subunit A, partial [Planctomycetota bacterium]